MRGVSPAERAAGRLNGAATVRSAESLGVRTHRWFWQAAMVFVLIAPIAAGFWADQSRSRERRVYAAALAQLERGELEPALASTHQLARMRILSSTGRREAAELYFRLGEDQDAHRLLLGRKFSEKNPKDQALAELAGRSQKAAGLLKEATRSRDPEVRVGFVRKALKELPDAPQLLLRLAEEELLALLRRPDAAHQKSFEFAYADLRSRAPALADSLKEHVAQLRGKGKAEGP